MGEGVLERRDVSGTYLERGGLVGDVGRRGGGTNKVEEESDEQDNICEIPDQEREGQLGEDDEEGVEQMQEGL